MRQLMAHFNRKKLLMIGVPVLIVLGVGLYCIASNQAWQPIKTAASTETARVKNLLRVLATTKNKSDKTSLDKSRLAIEALARLNPSTSCRPGRLYAWQTFIPTFSNYRKECKSKLSAIKKFQISAKELSEMLEGEDAIAKILQPISINKPLSEEAWQTQYDAVSSARKSLTKLVVSDLTKPTKKASLDSIAPLEQTWKNLAEVAKTHDANAFKLAQATLPKNYEAFKRVQETSQTAYSSSIEKLLADKL